MNFCNTTRERERGEREENKGISYVKKICIATKMLQYLMNQLLFSIYDVNKFIIIPTFNGEKKVFNSAE